MYAIRSYYDEFGEMEQSFEALFEESLQELSVGDVVKGTIVQVNPDSVIVDVGFKSEGMIPLSEFVDEKGEINVNVGDVYDVLVERTESDSGLISLSKEKADRQKIWNSLEEGAVVEGRIISRIKGGLSVDIGVNAFLPGSQVDLRPVRNLDKLLGDTFQFKIIKLNVITSYSIHYTKLYDIDAAEVDEGAVVGDVLHHAAEHLALGQCLEGLLLLLGVLFLEQ